MAGKVQVARRERLNRLCKSIISDPRSVDAGTVAEFKSTALRYAQAHTHTHYDDPERVFKNLYHDEGELGDLVRGAFDVVVSKQLDNEEISPLTGAANPRNRSGVIDNEEKDDLMTDNINKAH